jgi:hypothetical protein
MGTRPFDRNEHQQQKPNCCSDTAAKVPKSNNHDDQSKADDRHATTTTNEDQYDHETVLAKILNEKKLVSKQNFNHEHPTKPLQSTGSN